MQRRRLAAVTAALLSVAAAVRVAFGGAALGHQQIGSSTPRSLVSSAASSSSIVLITSSVDRHARLSCVGAAVAPRYVVTTGDCLERLRKGKKSVELLVHTHSQGASATVPVADAATENGVVVVWLAQQLPAEQATAALFVGSAQDEDSGGTQLNVPVARERALSVQRAQLLPLSMCEDKGASILRVNVSRHVSSWMCIDAEPFGATCQGGNASQGAVHAQDALLVGYDESAHQDVLWGLAWGKSTQCAAESAGSPASTAVLTFSPYRAFIALFVKGLKWTVGERRKTKPLPSSLYPAYPSFLSGSSGSQANETAGGSAGADTRRGDSASQPPQIVPEWMQNLPMPAVWLSPTTAVSPQNGTIAWLISTKHLVTSRSWFKGDVASLKWATTAQGSQLPIIRVESESDFYANSSAKTDLLVVELQHGVPDFVVNQLVSVGPKIDTEYTDVNAVLFQNLPGFDIPSKAQSSSSGSCFRGSSDDVGDDTGPQDRGAGPSYRLAIDVDFSHSSVCGSDQDSEDGAFCVHVSVPGDERLSTPVIVVLENQSLLGLSYRAGPDESSFSMMSLSAPTRRTFLDWATNGEVEWLSSDILSEDAERIASFPSYIGRLSSANASSTFESCECVLVTSRFVLTTASCMSAYGAFSTVIFTTPDGEATEYNVSSFQEPHPAYLTPDDFVNDIAVIRLEDDVQGISPVALNPGYSDWIVNVTIESRDQVELYGVPSSTKESKTLEACREATVKRRGRQPRGICVPRSSVGRELLPHRGNPLIIKSKQGVITAMGLAVGPAGGVDEDDEDRSLAGSSDAGFDGDVVVGDDVPLENSSDDVKVYMSFAENANFINGYTPGVTWGKRMMGKVAPIEPPSYVVGLRIDRDGPSFCSGTLIASSYVMTAAHCVDDALAKYVVIGAGTDDEEVLPVILSDLRVHPSYGSPHQFSYDAAIFELRVPANSYGISLDAATDFEHKTRATMFGFGSQASSIHSVDLPLYSREQCVATLPNIDDSMLCAGGEDGKDACQGDSGGPLVLTRDGTARLVGIVSAGYGCGIAGVPGIYARVSSLAQFIDSYVVGKRWESDGEHPPASVGSGRPVTRPPGQNTTAPSQSKNETRSGVDADDIESYSRDKNSTVPGGHNQTGDTQLPVAGQGVFDLAVKETVLSDDINSRVRVALLAFLMSDYKSFLERPTSPLHALVDPTNVVSFWNRDGASGVLDVLHRRGKLPLYTRQDRFGRGLRVAALWEEPSGLVSKLFCQQQ